MRGRVRWLLVAALAFAACSGGKGEPAPKAQGIGRRIAAGDVRVLLPSADGAWLAWLDGCNVAKGQYLPPGTANCSLRVAPAAGGEAVKVAGAVTTLPRGLAWSPTGAWLAALAEYDYAAGSGTLVLWRDGAARELAKDVTFYGFGARGELGWISGGTFSVLLPPGGLDAGADVPRAVAGAEGVTSFELSPADAPWGVSDGAPDVRLAVRKGAAAGGQLLVGGPWLSGAEPIGPGRVAEYGFSPNGEHLAYTLEGKGRGEVHRVGVLLWLVDVRAGVSRWRNDVRLGTGPGGFAFAPDGETLAFVADVVPGKQGNLYLSVPGKAPFVVGHDVGEYRWARSAQRIAWLEKYDPRTRSGAIGTAGITLAPRTVGRNITDFDVSADGRFVAYLEHTTRGGYSVDLSIVPFEGPPAPVSVAQGVFGFAFSPDSKWLYYRTRCVRNGEGCDLERVPAAGLPKDGKPEVVTQGMKSFEFDPRDPSRLLIGWQRSDRPALDVGVWKDGKLVRVDQVVLPGSARFLGPDSRRLGYAVIDPKRPGVYVADLP